MLVQAGRMRLVIAAPAPEGSSGQLRRAQEGDRTLRASDAERESVIAQLSEHARLGRITLDELAERIADASAARQRCQLDGLLVDLPALRFPVRRPFGRRGLRRHARAFAAVNGATFAAWGLLGAESVAADAVLWPLCLAAAWGCGLLTHRRLVLGVGAGKRPDATACPSPLGG